MVAATSLKNLERGRRFGSGQPVDRGGRPRGKSLAGYLRHISECSITYTDFTGNRYPMPVAQALALALVAKALQERDVKAIEAIYSHLDKLPAEVAVPDALDPACLAILKAAGIAHFQA